MTCPHSYAVQGGKSLYLVGHTLGHRKASNTERYAHLDDDPVRVAANQISGRLDALMSGKIGRKVVPFHRGRPLGAISVSGGSGGT